MEESWPGDKTMKQCAPNTKKFYENEPQSLSNTPKMSQGEKKPVLYI